MNGDQMLGRQLASSVLAFCLLWSLIMVGVFARDPDGRYANSPHRNWFSAQHNSHGNQCCTNADGHEYDGRYTLNRDGSVTVEWRGKPHTIDSWKVLKDSNNPTGHAVWWYLLGPTGEPSDYCFAPGPLT
jgi:hypothetical protein